MSIRVISIVWDRFPEGGSKLLAMLALADWSNDAGERVYPSMATLAAKMRMSERSARRLVHDLTDSGYLELVKPNDGGRGITNRYRICLEKLSTFPILKPDNMTGFIKKNPDKSDKTLTPAAVNPDIAMSPEPLRTVNNNQGAAPVDNSGARTGAVAGACSPAGSTCRRPAAGPDSIAWGPPDENKEQVLRGYIRTLERAPETSRPPGELDRAKAELAELLLQKGRA